MKRALVFLLISLSIGLLADWYSINERISTQLFEITEDQSNSTTLQFTDHPTKSGTYYYYLKTKYGDYESLPSDTLNNDFTDLEPIEIPMVTRLMGNYPNPFTPETTISFSLHQDESVKPGLCSKILH